MNLQLELDYRVAYKALARAYEELVFCTIHAEMVGPHRRESAIDAFADASLYLERVRAGAASPQPPVQKGTP